MNHLGFLTPQDMRILITLALFQLFFVGLAQDQQVKLLQNIK